MVSEDPLVLRAGIPEAPENGRANAVLLSGLENALSCRVQILSGHRSERKTLAAECEPGRIIAAARAFEHRKIK